MRIDQFHALTFLNYSICAILNKSLFKNYIENNMYEDSKIHPS